MEGARGRWQQAVSPASRSQVATYSLAEELGFPTRSARRPPACMPGFVVRPPSPVRRQSRLSPSGSSERPLEGEEGPKDRGPRHVRRLLTSSKGGGRAWRPGNLPRWRRAIPRPGRRGGGDGSPRGPERRPRRPALLLRRGDRPLLTRLARPRPGEVGPGGGEGPRACAGGWRWHVASGQPRPRGLPLAGGPRGC